MRKWIDLFESRFESGQRWPDRLDQEGLVEYVRSIAPDGELEDEHDDHILEMLDHPDGARLQMAKLENLTFNGGFGEDSKVLRYAKRKTSPPPIIIADHHIVDGNHRVKAAMQNGLTELPAYVLHWDED
jgi:hypothetical protein